MFRIGAAVYTTDGHAGKLTRLVSDPESRNVSHLVVETAAAPPVALLVPAAAVTSGPANRIDLNLSSAELAQLPHYQQRYFISEEMLVCDNANRVIGKVKLVYHGGASEEGIQRALRLTDVTLADPATRNAVWGNFADDDIPLEMRERMLREGYVRIEGHGINGLNRFVMSEQIASVSGNRVKLTNSRDELVEPVGLERTMSRIGRIGEGMPVRDRANRPVGRVELVYYGGASEAAIARAELLDEATNALGLAHDTEVHTFARDNVPPETSAQMLREGYLRIEGPGISGPDQYLLPEQIAGVDRDGVRLYASRDALLSAPHQQEPDAPDQTG